jgi:hypothetical protein
VPSYGVCTCIYRLNCFWTPESRHGFYAIPFLTARLFSFSPLPPFSHLLSCFDFYRVARIVRSNCSLVDSFASGSFTLFFSGPGGCEFQLGDPTCHPLLLDHSPYSIVRINFFFLNPCIVQTNCDYAQFPFAQISCPRQGAFQGRAFINCQEQCLQSWQTQMMPQ